MSSKPHSHSHHHSHSQDPLDNKNSNILDNNLKNKKFRKILINLFLALVILFLTPFFISFLTEHSLESIRKDYQEEFDTGLSDTVLGKVVDIDEQNESIEGEKYTLQRIEVEIDDDQKVEIERTIYEKIPEIEVNKGDQVYLAIFENGGLPEYSFVDVYRLDRVVWVIAAFVFLVVILTGIKGFNAFIGLVFATFVIFQYLLPEVLVGSNILWTTFVTATLITAFSMFLSHGFNRFTSVAVASTFLIVILVGVLSSIVVEFMNFSGIITHELSNLATFQTLDRRPIDLSGLFLASIVLGTLGVLDDITIAQAVLVQELKNARPKAKKSEIFKRAFVFGREHIISLINTLSLAYVATALPFIIQILVFGFEDFWVVINNEAISGEVVRIVVGSSTLLLSIPLTTLLAVHYIKPETKQETSKS